jgi:2-dehydro-3-deoxygalactonokinase
MEDLTKNNTAHNPPCLIAIDWGTSNFRAFLLDSAGQILEKKFAKQGVLRVPRHYFKQTLTKQIKEWLHDYPKLPVIMSGMIGSRQGWKEVPYLMCPIDLTQIAQGIQEVFPNNNQWIVPGLRIDYEGGRVDVMRGEETQILGALTEHTDSETNPSTQVFCLPGTHCKWSWVEGKSLTHFTTFMTGEVFTLLAKHSILGKLMRNTRLDVPAFHRGLDWAEEDRNLLSLLFQARTQVLAGSLKLHEVHSFLSGLLIGQEIRQALKTPIPEKKVNLIGNTRIARLYTIALKRYGLEGVPLDVDEVTTRGLFKIATGAGLIP